MFHRATVFLAAAVLFALALAEPAYAVYTGDLKLLVQDPMGENVQGSSLNYGYTFSPKLSLDLQYRWEREKDPDLKLTTGLSYNLTDRLDLKVGFDYKWQPDLIGETGLQRRLLDTGIVYPNHVAESCPDCEFYDLIDAWYAGFISRATLDKRIDELARTHGLGPWDDPWEYPPGYFLSDEERTTSLILGFHLYPQVFVRGLDDFYRTGPDGAGALDRLQVGRVTTFNVLGGYSWSRQVPMLQGTNTLRLPQWNFPRGVLSGG